MSSMLYRSIVPFLVLSSSLVTTDAFHCSNIVKKPNLSSFTQLKEQKFDCLNEVGGQEETLSSQLKSRRKIFKTVGSSIAVSFLTLGGSKSSSALDMDAFMSKELEGDKNKSEISDDVKTCKYAAPGKVKGDACVRAGMRTTGKNGGVDAYGNLDRGDYVRCSTSYPMIDGKYVKTTTCE